MTALPDWDIASDAQLAGAAVAGDRAAFAGIYDRYADRLHDFCIGMVCDREAAADCVQEVFCTAAVQLTKLRDPDKLRPWLYAIARNEALRCIRLRRRESASDELPEAESLEAGPDTLAARTELANLIAEAAGGLSDRDRSVLELSYRHGLDGPELAEALGVSPSNATKLVQRLRETVERSLGALLVARGVQRNPQECSELGAILANWDGHFSVLMRKRIARHIDDCETCERNRRNLVSPKALLGVVPILVAAPWWLRGQTLTKVQLTSADFDLTANGDASSALTAVHTGYRQEGATRGDAGADSQFDAGETQGRRSRLIQAIWALAVILIVAMGLTFIWLHHQKTAVAPDVIKIAPTPTEASVPPPPAGSQLPAFPPPPSNPGATMPAVPPVPPGQAPAPIYNPAPNAPIPTAAPPAQPPPAVVPVPVRPPVWIAPNLPPPPQLTIPKFPPPRSTPTSVVPPPRRGTLN
ncbi:RNA polymerase sigma factor [Mycobacterium sp.]|uniref:RNA polymerase sigma factor n=1 Tax=Mycobacterium sp. TaxID=1785 RepID=UPI003F95BC9F